VVSSLQVSLPKFRLYLYALHAADLSFKYVILFSSKIIVFFFTLHIRSGLGRGTRRFVTGLVCEDISSLSKTTNTEMA
jgi:hypothetical protein